MWTIIREIATIIMGVASNVITNYASKPKVEATTTESYMDHLIEQPDVGDVIRKYRML